ncbi:MAG: CBS domain-containing protein [Candidatus Binatia bacterium]
MAELRVADRMNRDLVTVTTADTCHWALRVMNAAEVAEVMVLDGNRVVGILSDRDIYRMAMQALFARPPDERHTFLSYVNVAGVMTYAPVTVSPSAPLKEAVAIMLERGIETVPVVERGRLLGTLSAADALRILFEALHGAVPPDRGS